jgi:hypothetical protein
MVSGNFSKDGGSDAQGADRKTGITVKMSKRFVDSKCSQGRQAATDYQGAA